MHVPVVLIPLVLLLCLPAVFSGRWFRATGPFALALSFAAAVGSVLATSSGEDLEARLGEQSTLLEQHAQLGELTRNLAVVLFVLLLAQVILFWRRRRPLFPVAGMLRLPLSLLVAAVALATTITAVLAGHAGAQLVW